jgi:hypothetical protein
MNNTPDYIDSDKKAYYLWHNGGIKTNLDTWLSEAETDSDKEKVINNITWLIGRVVDNTSYNPYLLGKYKADGSASDFISSLKNKTIEGNSYISTYSCVN